MTLENKKNFCMQAFVVMILLFSLGVSAAHSNTVSTSITSMYVESTFYDGDVPAISLMVTLPGVLYGDTVLAGEDFATVELPGEGFTTVVGEPRLPTFCRFIEIPQNADPELIIESVIWETTSLVDLHLPSSIIPVQPSLIKIPGASVDYTIDDTYYTTDVFLPSTIADVTSIGEIRGRHVGFLRISPVQYNPVSGELRIMTQCDLRIDLLGSDMQKTTETIDRYSTLSFEPLLQTTFVNYGLFQGNEKNQQRQEMYLIVVADSLYDAIEPLATWKETKGFEVTVTKTSEIPSGPTKENIKAYIADAYDTWPTPPTYVLLVGDVPLIPSWTGSDTGTCTDLYYVTVNGTDYFADIIISRFPAATTEHVTTMVDKTIYYEQGLFPDLSWIKKAVFMASNDNYQVSEGTHNYVIDTYLTPNNYTCDKLYCHTYGATTGQVTAALNDGRSLAIFSGHGSTTSWADGPSFTQSNVNSLTNGGMYPFVCSHSCLTNQFSIGECFGETWLRAPDKGGLAFWGASTYSYWSEDDVLEKGMFKAWWEDGIETIGGMTNMGLFYLYQHYGGGGMSRYYFEEYNVLGDSSVALWHDDPNGPPEIPETPVGPATGQIGMEYTFTTSTIDPEGEQVYYLFNWGDGTFSDWVGPFNSGAEGNAEHTYTALGTFNITVKAKDANQRESGWSAPALITILALPQIEIGAITGGFGIKADIKNTGGAAASNITWIITINNGFVLTERVTTGNISTISAGSHTKVESDMMFGIGSVEIAVTANEVTKTAQAFLLGPFFLKVV